MSHSENYLDPVVYLNKMTMQTLIFPAAAFDFSTAAEKLEHPTCCWS